MVKDEDTDVFPAENVSASSCTGQHVASNSYQPVALTELDFELH